MFVRLSGKITFVSPVQLKNAYHPMPVRLSGKVTLVSAVQLENDLIPMCVTPF